LLDHDQRRHPQPRPEVETADPTEPTSTATSMEDCPQRLDHPLRRPPHRRLLTMTITTVYTENLTVPSSARRARADRICPRGSAAPGSLGRIPRAALDLADEDGTLLE
jgi:hypothetical protein